MGIRNILPGSTLRNIGDHIKRLRGERPIDMGLRTGGDSQYVT